MTKSGAEQTIVVSALIVGGVYAYRTLTEGTGTATGGRVKQLAGEGSPPELGVFITAWGTTFLVISMLAAASPSFGGSLALLVATGDLLNNARQVKDDINTKLTAGSPKPASTSSTSLSPSQINNALAHPLTSTPTGHDAHRSLGGLS